MTRTRILAATLALVAFGGLTACQPQQFMNRPVIVGEAPQDSRPCRSTESDCPVPPRRPCRSTESDCPPCNPTTTSDCTTTSTTVDLP